MKEPRSVHEAELRAREFDRAMDALRAQVDRNMGRFWFWFKFQFRYFHYDPARARFKQLDLVDTVCGAAKLLAWIVLDA